MQTSRRAQLLLFGLFLIPVSACKTKPAEPPASVAGSAGAPAPALQPPPAPPIIPIDPRGGPAGDLEVVVARPQGEAEGNFHPTLTFSHPIVALSMIEEQRRLPPPATITPAIPGEWRWIGSSSVEFIPKQAVPLSTSFRVTVAAGYAALDGAKLKADYSWQFTTPRPELQRVAPKPTYPWLGLTPTFRLVFNQAVKDLSAHVHLRVEGKEVALTLVKEESTQQLKDEHARAQHGARRWERTEVDEDRVDRRMRYLFTPQTPLPTNSEVTLQVDGQLSGREGPLSIEKPISISYRTYGPPKLGEIRACSDFAGRCNYGPLLIKTKTPVDLKTLKSVLTITPKVEIDWEHAEMSWEPSPDDEVRYDPDTKPPWEPHFSLPGKFRPGALYTVKIAKGWKDAFGQSMAAYSESVQLSDLEPSITVEQQALLEAGGDGSLPIESENVRTLNADVWVLTPEEMARLEEHHGDGYGAPKYPERRPNKQLSLDLSAAHNNTLWSPLPLRSALPEGQRTGLLLARLTSPQLIRDPSQKRTIAQITDLAVHAKLGKKNSLAWVTSLASGSPVAGATVAVYDLTGAKKWSGVTAADGTVRMPSLVAMVGYSKQDWTAPFALVSATKGTDTGVTLSEWQSGYSASVWHSDITENDTTGVVFTDRGIYRPGDEVFVKGIARILRMGELTSLPPQTPIKLTITGPYEKKLREETLRASGFGTYTTKLVVPKDATLGNYDIRAQIQLGESELVYEGAFRVAEYRAPQFRVEVSAKPWVIAGEPLTASVLSRYLFGGAMAGVKLRYTVSRRSESEFEPAAPELKGFAFGRHTWGWNDSAPETSSDVAAAGEGEADRQGSYNIVVPKAEAPSSRTWKYTVEAEAEDVSRHRVAARAEVIVHPAALYAGVKIGGDRFPESGKPVRIEVAAATAEGKAQLGVPIAVEMKRRQWKFIRKKGVGSGWFTESEPDDQKVAGCEVKSAAPTNAASCSFTPAEPGTYLVSATVRDDQGRTQTTIDTLYVSGSGWVSWQRNDTEKLELIADKNEYAVGETAQILIKNAFPSARALVTTEREGVNTTRVVTLDRSAVTVPIAIDEAAVPNTYVSVVLVRGRVRAEPTKKGVAGSAEDPGHPEVRIGTLSLKVAARTRQLSVEVKPDSESKRPGEKLRIAVQVKDFRGKAPGVPTEVTLWAVDEGVLRLTSYELPDLLNKFYERRQHTVRYSESLLRLVLRRLYGEKGQTPGGSGGLDPIGGDFRRTFRTTALFAPALITDAEGRTQAELTLPDNLTTFRIMAVAVTAKDRFGGGQSKVVVSKPLLVLPALPRLARVGDKFEAGVVVHRGEQTKGTLPVTVTAQATGLKLLSPATTRVELADGKAREVRFQLVAEQPGTAVLRFRVEGGGERDALEEKLPVQLSVEREAIATYGDTHDRRVEGLLPPKGVRTDYGGLELTMSSTALSGFAENFRQLVDYPYGCLEQLSSRLVPFVALREIQKTFGVQATGGAEREKERQRIQELFFGLGLTTSGASPKSEPDQVAAETIAAIEKLQNTDGGFRYWSNSLCADDWGSAYAVLALGRARRSGYAVDKEVLSRGQSFLADIVAAGKPVPCDWSYKRLPPDDATRIFALYALSSIGAPRASYYGEIFRRRDKLPLFARAMLVESMVRGGGDREQARQLLRELLNFAKESPNGVYFQETDAESYAETWTSDTRTTALVLQALLATQPEHPFVSKIGRYLTLIRKSDGRYRTTQEAAFSLLAQGDLVRIKEKEVPNFTASALFGKELLGSASFVGRSLNVQRIDVPIARIAGGPGQPLELSKQGAGIFYYSAMLRYAPSEPPTKPLEQGIVVQRWFEPYTGGGQSLSYAAGDLVRVRVRIGTSMERRYVAVDVPLPAGLEPVDATLSTTARLPKPGSGDDDEHEDDREKDVGASADRLTSEEFWSRWLGVFVSPFNHTEQRDDRVVLFADRLPPGVHAESFVARATTPGTFIARPARAEEMYTPEIFGRSEGGHLTVVAPEAKK